MGYMKIPNLYKEKDILLFKEVWAMEKIHGCVHFETPIRMFDYSLKPMSKVKVGDKVLGVNKKGIIVESKVLNKFDNGKAETWLQIVTTRNGAGRGPSTCKVICTPEHKFWNPESNSYCLAKDLKEGHKTVSIRNDYTLSFIQEQILLGKMLGDGSIILRNNSANIQFGHKIDHEDYVQYCVDSLGEIAYKIDKNQVSGYGTEMSRAQTFTNHFIFKKFKDFTSEHKKIVPEWVSRELSPIALAFWYMDDGSLTHTDMQEDRISLATCGFSENDCQILIIALKNLGITAQLKKYPCSSYNRITINAKNSDKMFSLIYPYMPELMQYKLPTKFRGLGNSLPKLHGGVKQTLVTQTIKSIRNITKKCRPSKKHDIETETGNYFAGDTLVHNSSAHVSYNEGKLGFFSGGENYQNFLTLFNHDELLERFNEKFGKANIEGAVIVFGEAYGGKQQRMGDVYGPNLKFVAFDVKLGESWLPVPVAHRICEDLGVDFVHYERVSTDLVELDRMRDMHSIQAIKNGMGEGKESEGVVLRPLIEVRKNNGERIIAKHKRDKFRETATVRKVDDSEKLKILEDANAIAEEWCVAHRLEHILGKMQEPSMEKMRDIIIAMQLDIQREAEGEIVWNEDVCKAIGRKTAYLAKKYFISQLKEV